MSQRSAAAARRQSLSSLLVMAAHSLHSAIPIGCVTAGLAALAYCRFRSADRSKPSDERNPEAKSIRLVSFQEEPKQLEELSESPCAVTEALDEEDMAHRYRSRTACDPQESPRPDYELLQSAYSGETCDHISDWCLDGLSEDPTSAHFMKRKKAICYVMNIAGGLYTLEQSYFVQSSAYNDFSGGMRRHYAKIPDEIVQKHLASAILRFIDYYSLPEKSCILVQLQFSVIPGKKDLPAKEARLVRKQSVAGQGIHTDGQNRAGLVCIRRRNVTGADNQFHARVDGTEPISEPITLSEGDCVFFKDNEIYHHVTPAAPEDGRKDTERLMLLMHWPADAQLVGNTNPENILSVREADVKLRKFYRAKSMKRAGTRSTFEFDHT